MKIIVINLARAVDRRQAMTEMLLSLGMEFKILEATDWKELTEQDCSLVDTATRERQGQKPLSKSMIAAVTSHRRALAELIASEDEMAVIFEDDVTILPEVKDVLALVESSEIDFDVIFLHRGRSRNTFVPLKRIGRYRLGIVKFSDWGTQGYIITRNAAQLYFGHYPKIVYRSDHSLHAYWENGLKTFSLDPPVVHHDNQSGPHSFLDEVKIDGRSRPVAARARRLRTELTKEFQRRRAFGRRVREAFDGADSPITST